MTLLFTILFGIVEFGITFSKYQSFLGAAREGARYAAVRCAPDSSTVCDDALIANRVTLTSVYTIGPGSPTEDIVCSDTTRGDPVTVTWSQHFTISIPFVPDLSFDKDMKGVFRCE
jgi:Flp pilus assembly protein TadG